MQLEAVIGFGLCAAALSMLLRQYRPEYALFLSLLCGVGILLWLVQTLSPMLGELEQLAKLALSENEGAQILLKSLGICLVTQAASDTCRDIGEAAIASRLELAGRAAMLLLAMPLFGQLLEQALRLIG